VEKTNVMDFSINEVGLEIVEGLCGVEAGSVVAVGELGNEAEVQVVRRDRELVLVVEDSVHCCAMSRGNLT
jgi:hypothetical protein